MDISYSSASIKFVHINSESKDIELCQAGEFDLEYDKSDIIEMLDNEIITKKEEVKDLERKKDIFLKRFGKYFETNA